jgi:hypothetical protein
MSSRSGCVCCKISNLTDAARRNGHASEIGSARRHIARLKQYEGIETLCTDHAPRMRPFAQMVEHWLDRVEQRGPEQG